VHAVWSQAHNDLPGLIESMQPKLGELAAKALAIVAALGGSLLMFLCSFVIAGIIMAYGVSGAWVTQEIFERIVGIARGEEFTKLSTATVRAVASGVIGIACIQALILGVSLMIAGVPFAGVPFAGVLAVVVLVFGVAQLPALIVTLPVIGWIGAIGEYNTGPAVAYTALLFVGGMADNVLKRNRPRAGLSDIHAQGARQPGAGAANRCGRFPLHDVSRCDDVSPARLELACPRSLVAGGLVERLARFTYGRTAALQRCKQVKVPRKSPPPLASTCGP
jgi:hypothetical protein